jgi:hypothetical protein
MEDPGGDGRIIFKWILKKWNGGMNWIDLARNRGRIIFKWILKKWDGGMD